MGWYVNGKDLNYEEYTEYLKKDLEERYARAVEAQRLIAELGAAYRTCTEFLAEHPELHYKVDDAGARDHALLQKLRENLERADGAPRCEKVREDGTVCGSPQMRGYRYCYAHERMLQTQSQKLQLPALEDANGVQMAIMRVQKALLDDEISEKKAGLLLYSLQMASSNLKYTTFTCDDKEVVTEMPEEEAVSETAVSTQRSAFSQGKGNTLPRITLPRIGADERGSEEAVGSRHGETALSSRHSAVSRERLSATFTTEATEEHGGEGGPQPGAAVRHEYRVDGNSVEGDKFPVSPQGCTSETYAKLG